MGKIVRGILDLRHHEVHDVILIDVINQHGFGGERKLEEGNVLEINGPVLLQWSFEDTYASPVQSVPPSLSYHHPEGGICHSVQVDIMELEIVDHVIGGGKRDVYMAGGAVMLRILCRIQAVIEATSP